MTPELTAFIFFVLAVAVIDLMTGSILLRMTGRILKMTGSIFLLMTGAIWMTGSILIACMMPFGVVALFLLGPIVLVLWLVYSLVSWLF